MTKIQFDSTQAGEAIDGETIWQVAKRRAVKSHLCYSPEPDFGPMELRACMVEVEGERVLARPASERRASA